MSPVTVLFICIGNSCRSPIAESIARELGRGNVVAKSAGLAPAGWIAEPTISTLAELGYPSDDLYSKGLAEAGIDDVDVVVSLLGEQGLDHLPHRLDAERIAWQVRDPFGEDEEVYFAVARQLETRIRQLLAEQLGEELPITR